MFMALGALAGGLLGAGAAAGTTFSVLGMGAAASGALVGGLGGASIGGQVDAGSRLASANRRQAELSNEATERAYYYNTAAWQMKKDQLIADREHALLELQARAINEDKRRLYGDAQNLQKYNYDVMIRDREQQSLDAQYDRSNQIYDLQTTYNAMAKQAGVDQEYHKLEEVQAETRFDSEEIRLQALMDEGKLRALGISGNAEDKALNSIWLKTGKRIAALNASLQSAGSAAKSVIDEIARDKDTADLAAFAAKMLDPGILPDVIQPIAIPTTEWVMPRVWEEYDFGPQPVRGAYYDANAAADRAWGSTISGIAGSLPGLYSFAKKL